MFYLTTHILFTVIWRRTYGKEPFRLRERKPATATWATPSDYQQGFFYMHHPTDRLGHTTAFVKPVVKHWLERDLNERDADSWCMYSCTKQTRAINRNKK